MIFVDMTGAAFPEIHHSPWDGIRLADFVMPFFDFMVGVSLAIAFKRFDLESTSSHRWDAFKKATIRFLKLFILGVLTQVSCSLLEPWDERKMEGRKERKEGRKKERMRKIGVKEKLRK
jgi:predicted acyltransferase